MHGNEKADTSADANADADGIRNKNNISPPSGFAHHLLVKNPNKLFQAIGINTDKLTYDFKV